MHSSSNVDPLHIASLGETDQQTAILLTVYVAVGGELESRIPVEELIPRFDLEKALWERLGDLSVRRWLEVAPGPDVLMDIPGLGRVEAILRKGAVALPRSLHTLCEEAHRTFIERNWEQFRLLRCVHRHVKGRNPPWADLEEVMKELEMDDSTLDRVMRRCLALDVLDVPESWSVGLTELGLEASEGWTKRLTQAEEREPEDWEDFEAVLTMEWAGRFEGELQVFKKQGEVWLTTYEGVTKTFVQSLGMQYIALLLTNPGKQFAAVQLQALVAGSGEVIPQGTAGPILDATAIEHYRRRVADIDAEILEAEENNDFASLERLSQERKALYSEAGRGLGLGGRVRHAADDQERSRQAVSKVMHRAMDTIEQENEPLATHIRSFINIGQFLSYRPDRPMFWDTGT